MLNKNCGNTHEYQNEKQKKKYHTVYKSEKAVTQTVPTAFYPRKGTDRVSESYVLSEHETDEQSPETQLC
jgi:hypothetical protein